jgi:multiple sugar transport system permease protein
MASSRNANQPGLPLSAPQATPRALPAVGVIDRLANSKDFLSVALLVPAFAVLALVFAYPVANSLLLAFQKQDLLNPGAGVTFIGLANFEWLFRQENFWNAVRITTLLTVLVVVLEIAIGLGIAMLIAEAFPGVAFVRGMFILPWAIPSIVVAFVMRLYLAPRFGLFNQVLATVSPPWLLTDWFGNASLALLSVTAVITWKGLPFVILVLLAGLQSIPKELGEAARIDGANGWQEFRYITVPSLSLVILVVAIFRIIGTFNGFDLVYLLTGGGPADATKVLAIEVYNRAFGAYQMGRAASITFLMFIVLGLLIFWLLSIQRDEQEAR